MQAKEKITNLFKYILFEEFEKGTLQFEGHSVHISCCSDFQQLLHCTVDEF